MKSTRKPYEKLSTPKANPCGSAVARIELGSQESPKSTMPEQPSAALDEHVYVLPGQQ